jgi:polyhydroxyalkanoate synthesis repressor PhaR
MSQEHKTRVIKRYANRKLYDTEDSRYVTLDEIAALVKAQQEVQILDNRTGEDLTEVTLAQILFEEQKKQKTRMPLGLLKDLISTSGDTITEFLQRKVAQPVQTFRDQAEKKVDEIRRKSETTVEDKARQVREFFTSTQRSLDEIQRKLDDRIQGVLANMPGVRGQLQMLRKRFEELESRLHDSSQDDPPPEE